MNRRGMLVIAMLAICIATGGRGAQQGYQPVTAEDPEILVEDLQRLLKPLRKQQLVIETEAWLALLQNKVREISLAEIEMKEKGRQISETKAEIKEDVKEIKKAEEPQEPADDQTPDTGDAPLKADAKVQEKLQGIEKKTEEITEVTAKIANDVNTAAEDDMRSSEKDVLKKTQEIEEAKEKLKKTAAEVADGQLGLVEKVKKIGEAEIALQTKVREQLLANINKLREEQTALTDRVRIVIDALEAKGGDVEEYRKYVTAISGLKVDVRDISATRSIIVGWLKSPEGGLRWGKNILSFIVIVVLAKIVSLILGTITRRAVEMNKKCSDLLRNFLVNIVQKAIFVIGVVMALSMLGINIGPLVAGIGAIGFVLAFALQGTLGNFAAGLMILTHRPYDVGDIIKTAGITGIVQSMNLNTTTIKTFDNQVVVVPNGSIWGDNITNVTGSDTRRVDMVFGIGYNDDIGKAQQVLEDIVRSHPLVLEEPAPNVKVHELGDSSVNFICRPWTKTSNYWTVYWDITRQVKERFDAEGVSIPFPQHDVHFYNEAVDNGPSAPAA